MTRSAERLEEALVAVALRQAFGGDQEVANPRRLGQQQVHDLLLGGALSELVALEPLEPRLAAAGLLGALAGLVAGDELLLAADPVELLLVVAALRQHPLGAERDEVLVVARILAQPSLIDLDDPRHHAVEQPAVMAHDDHGAGELLGEEGLEPLPSLDVEVVRRLVEQQQIRLLEQQPREAEPRLLPARERADLLRELRVGEAEAVQRRVDLVVDRVAAERLDARLDLRLPLEQAIEPVGILALRSRHRGEDRVDLLMRRVQVGEGAFRGRAASRPDRGGDPARGSPRGIRATCRSSRSRPS